jgi:hypothetical protein
MKPITSDERIRACNRRASVATLQEQVRIRKKNLVAKCIRYRFRHEFHRLTERGLPIFYRRIGFVSSRTALTGFNRLARCGMILAQ